MTQHIDQLDIEQAQLDADDAPANVVALRLAPPLERLRSTQVRAFEKSRLASFRDRVSANAVGGAA